MMNARSLRVRVAAWYFVTVTAIFALAAAGYWLTVRSALERALDQGLRYRLAGLRQYLDTTDPSQRDDLGASLNRLFRLGELYQVFDADGRLVAQSYGLDRHRVRPQPPSDVGTEIRFESGGPGSFPLRLASQRVTIAGRSLILVAADPQRKFDGVLGAFTWILLLSTPVILTLALGGGLWLGRRALAPVARITQDARAITESNLSARLAVPDSRDELQKLSETLNDMLDRIEQSFTRTRQFTADASHELRAPMTLIHTAAEYSLRRERSREDLVDSMRKILTESQRTAAIIDDLLLLARGDAGQEPSGLELVDAVPVLREATEQGKVIAADRNIDVTLQLEAEALPVKANEPRLRRLLLILVDNALKYTPPGGRVTLTGRAEPHEVTITVVDTGKGIAPDDLPHVFERFWRADKVRSREAGGTGLGLAIARQIAELHGARIDVASELGRGSAFTVRLPNGSGC
jgi:heavy metal sensor kinase